MAKQLGSAGLFLQKHRLRKTFGLSRTLITNAVAEKNEKGSTIAFVKTLPLGQMKMVLSIPLVYNLLNFCEGLSRSPRRFHKSSTFTRYPNVVLFAIDCMEEKISLPI
jgi:hypothetical protein